MERDRQSHREPVFLSASGNHSEEDEEADANTPLLKTSGSERRAHGKSSNKQPEEERWPWSQRLYAVYVLVMMQLAYLLNQLDRYMLAITIQPLARELHFGDRACAVNQSMSENVTAGTHCNATTIDSCLSTTSPRGEGGVCVWDYNGQGLEYQILAGPVFIFIYTFAGIFISFAADLYNRKVLLAFCLILWSVATGLTGLVKEYWQLVILRFILGFGEAGCTPFAVSILSDYFPASLRGLVIGLYNLGIYTGYSMSYTVGNFVTLANINNQGWRWAFFVSGIPGVILGFVILLTVLEPGRNSAQGQVSGGHRPSDVEWMSACQKLKCTLKPFISASIILLCLGGSIRNAAGYVWAYNTQPYFKAVGQTATQIATFMSWIPMVAGSIGVTLGGVVSDLLRKSLGIVARVLVLTVSQLSASPFAAGTLFFSGPAAYAMQIPTYIIGEMWVGVTLTVLVELVDPRFKTSAVAVYLFIITNIGGSIPLLVPPIQKAFERAGSTNAEALRNALYFLYPGLYVGGGFLFLMTIFSLRRDARRAGYSRMDENGPGTQNND